MKTSTYGWMNELVFVFVIIHWMRYVYKHYILLRYLIHSAPYIPIFISDDKFWYFTNTPMFILMTGGFIYFASTSNSSIGLFRKILGQLLVSRIEYEFKKLRQRICDASIYKCWIHSKKSEWELSSFWRDDASLDICDLRQLCLLYAGICFKSEILRSEQQIVLCSALFAEMEICSLSVISPLNRNTFDAQYIYSTLKSHQNIIVIFKTKRSPP